jgi:hypothetical protein
MDKIKIEILADGTVKSATPSISEENHSSADAFFDNLKEFTGGKETRTVRSDIDELEHHHHDHSHEDH